MKVDFVNDGALTSLCVRDMRTVSPQGVSYTKRLNVKSIKKGLESM